MKRCVIQLGNHSVTMDVIVSKNVPEVKKSAISDASETKDKIIAENKINAQVLHVNSLSPVVYSLYEV